MTRYAVTRLANRLLQLHGTSGSFDFEVDTVDNAQLLGAALESQGCRVAFSSHGSRLWVQLPSNGSDYSSTDASF